MFFGNAVLNNTKGIFAMEMQPADTVEYIQWYPLEQTKTSLFISSYFA